MVCQALWVWRDPVGLGGRWGSMGGSVGPGVHVRLEGSLCAPFRRGSMGGSVDLGRLWGGSPWVRGTGGGSEGSCGSGVGHCGSLWGSVGPGGL